MTWQDGMDALSNAKQVNVLYNLESGLMRISIDWSAVFEMKNPTIFIYTNTSYGVPRENPVVPYKLSRSRDD